MPRKTAAKRKKDEDYELDSEEAEDMAENPPAKKKRAPRKKSAPRLKRVTKKTRDATVIQRMEGVKPRRNFNSVTSWDIGETYMAAVRIDVATMRLTHAATVNLKWDRERPTIRCETDTLNKFINDNPELCDTDLWILEEQFDDSESLRAALPKLVNSADIISENIKSKRIKLDLDAVAWDRIEQAVQEAVYKGPAMPVLETSVRTQALARGKQVYSILPRHVKKHYGLPCAGHDANKIMSEEFVVPRLTEEEKEIIHAANEKREKENAERGEKRQDREHDMHEAWMNALFGVSVLHQDDYMVLRTVIELLDKPNCTGFVFD